MAARVYTTVESASITRSSAKTWRKNYSLNGHHHGIKPIKQPSGRLLWPADEVDRLVSGEATRHTETAAQHA
ncbi:MAG: hypothetical protein IV112_07540 [Methyloversatilis discipulorum]|uniref:hypothetical protein n=1 Tax=Methyloversatilis discipulorum TaxID=1119528 RepID=UPI0026EEAF88|nr:hypothetical protein [Methyloversatilis discipulorum]MBT9516529.1 hypothetical protein [Methyloversatilis discipulorum]